MKIILCFVVITAVWLALGLSFTAPSLLAIIGLTLLANEATKLSGDEK